MDVIVLCIGEDTYAETPGNINSLMLSESQVALGTALALLDKPIVLIYLGGRPRIITELARDSSAVLLAFLPGNRGAEAIANILYGQYNPNARLPITYPKYPNGITTYDFLPIEVAWGNYYENLFPFGHGLSYTTFEYSHLELSTKRLEAPENLTVNVSVRNTGAYDGKEVVMLYLNDEYGSVPRPMRQLKGFEKVEVKVGETKRVSFVLGVEDLSFINTKSQRVYEAGRFYVYVGSLEDSFVLTKSGIIKTNNGIKKTNQVEEVYFIETNN